MIVFKGFPMNNGSFIIAQAIGIIGSGIIVTLIHIIILSKKLIERGDIHERNN